MNVQETYKKLIEISGERNSKAIEQGIYLCELKDNGGYKEIVGEGGTWTDFLATPELGLASASAYRNMAIVRKYLQELQLPATRLHGIDILKLHLAVPKVTKENVEEWLDKAAALSRSDFLREVKFGEKDTMACEHVWKQLPVKCECSLCGEIKINREENKS